MGYEITGLQNYSDKYIKGFPLWPMSWESLCKLSCSISSLWNLMPSLVLTSVTSLIYHQHRSSQGVDNRRVNEMCFSSINKRLDNRFGKKTCVCHYPKCFQKNIRLIFFFFFSIGEGAFGDTYLCIKKNI